MKGFEDLKKILRDDSLHLAIGAIKKLHVASDRSYLKVEVTIFPEGRNIIATMTWESVGPNSGDYEFPEPGDMVIVGNAEGDDDQAFVLKRLSSRTDKIPAAAVAGDKVHRARAGNKYWNVSDTKIFLARGDTAPTQNLVLGQVFKTMMSNLLAKLKLHAQNDADHYHIGNLGYYTSVPVNQLDYLTRKDEYNTIKTSPVDDESVLSDLSYTEK